MPSFATNATDVFGQAARVLVGDPTEAAGAGLVDLGNVQRVGIQVQFGRQMISNEGNQLLKDGGYGWTKSARITLRMFSAQASFLAALMPEITATNDALAFRTDVAALTPPSLIIVPETEYGAADTSERVWYVPSVIMVDDPGEFIFKVEETQQSGEPFDVTLQAMIATEDQAGVALPAGKQLIFRGNKPAGWTFPAGYGA